MLNRLTANGRMYIINMAILVLFVTMAAEITSDITVSDQSAGEIASSEQVAVSADNLKKMATEVNPVAGNFKI